MHPGILLTFLLLMAALFGLTRHRELREEPDNGWRLLVSIPFAFGFSGLAMFTFGYPVSGGLAAFGLFSLVALAAMWRAHVAHFAARKTGLYLFGDGRAGGGFVPDFGHARGLMKDQKWTGAICEINEQLKKDPGNFEGNRLLISCYLDLEQPAKALETVRVLAASHSLTGEQNTWMVAARTQLEAAVDVRKDAEHRER